MKKLDAQVLICCAGLLSAGGVAISGHDGWGWILFVTLLIAG